MNNKQDGDRVDRMADPPHPGEIVRDCIRESGRTVKATATELGISRAGLNRLCAGQARLTAAVALQLEAQGWSNAETWLRMQCAYDLAQERLKAA